MKKRQTRKPNFFIVGAQRCGTTTLYHTLKKHPDIFMSPVKEPCFFIKQKTKKEWDEYLQLFQKSNKEKIIGEASTIYFHNKKSPYLIKNKTPNAKILIQLRSPVERTISAYKQNRKRGKEKLNLKDALTEENKRIQKNFDNSFYYFHKSIYYPQVKKFFDVFGEKSVKITVFEEFIQNPQKILNEIASFLEIDPKKFIQEIKKYNPGNQLGINCLNNFLTRKSFFKKFFKFILSTRIKKQIKEKIYWFPLSSKKIKVSFSEKEKKKLQKKFIPDIKKLENLIKKDLNCWLTK